MSPINVRKPPAGDESLAIVYTDARKAAREFRAEALSYSGPMGYILARIATKRAEFEEARMDAALQRMQEIATQAGEPVQWEIWGGIGMRVGP